MFRFAVLVAATTLSTAAFAADAPSVEFGKHISIVGGCHDCHTVGYAENGGKIDPDKALQGNPVGYVGPWGTNFARNLRITVSKMSEDDWVGFAKSFEVGPPMPWFNVHELNELESRSLYQYIKSLGPAGPQAPDDIPPKS
jgi:mono/diheme cytochrome c family protein